MYFGAKPFKALWTKSRILKSCPLRVGEPVYRPQNGTDMILFPGVSKVSRSRVFRQTFEDVGWWHLWR